MEMPKGPDKTYQELLKEWEIEDKRQKPGPKPKKGPKCVRRSISIPVNIWEKLVADAAEQNVSISSLIRLRLSK